jgi:hypothetical protein
MFGLPSIGKIIVFLIIVIVVWKGFKFLERMSSETRGEPKRYPSNQRKRSMGDRFRRSTRTRHDHGGDEGFIEETEKCSKCGTYVSLDGVHNCGKSGCPY